VTELIDVFSAEEVTRVSGQMLLVAEGVPTIEQIVPVVAAPSQRLTSFWFVIQEEDYPILGDAQLSFPEMRSTICFGEIALAA